MDPWDIKSFVEGMLSKESTYKRYCDLCMRVEAVPIDEDDFVDKYVDIIVRREELYREAMSMLDSDKRQLLDELEKVGAPVEDLVMVDILPPSTTITLNKFNDGMICLYVMFPNGSDNPMIIPAYVGSGKDDAIFL